MCVYTVYVEDVEGGLHIDVRDFSDPAEAMEHTKEVMRRCSWAVRCEVEGPSGIIGEILDRRVDSKGVEA